jgi:putative DNA primase/helicase
VSTAEPPTGAALNDELIKKFTGGDTMTARGLNLPTFEFDPVGKLVMEVNQKPRIKGDDDGIWRRIWVIPFKVQIPREKQDKGLKHRLRGELDGVLAWIIEGTCEYLRQGLAPPDAIFDAVNAYRAEANPFGEWYRECCVLEETAEESASELYRSYRDWCDLQGYEPVKQASFGRSLATKQHPKGKANHEGKRGVIVRKGLRLDTLRDMEIQADLKVKRREEAATGGAGGFV